MVASSSKDKKLPKSKVPPRSKNLYLHKQAIRMRYPTSSPPRPLNKTLQSQLESARKAVIDAANTENILIDRLNTSKKNPATGKDYTQEEIDSIRSATVSARQAFGAAEQRYLDADTGIKSAQTTFSLAQLGLASTKDAHTQGSCRRHFVKLQAARRLFGSGRIARTYSRSAASRVYYQSLPLSHQG
ncbi:MAG: hypothetical protein KatS3mg087_1436 [Patescibacteria group bacterium]|nr:MAG: hypothetical protein KatS3mg087_1436 [Patescibacteria group bacterium]